MIAVRAYALHAVALSLLCAPAATAQPLPPTICLSISGAEDLPAAAALQLAIEHELEVPVRVELPCPAQSGVFGARWPHQRSHRATARRSGPGGRDHCFTGIELGS